MSWSLLWLKGIGSNIKANPLPLLFSQFLDSEHLASEPQRLPQLALRGWQLPSATMNDGFVYWSGEVTGTRLHLTLLPPGSILGGSRSSPHAVWFPKHVDRAPSRGRAGELTKCSAN